ncbi:MAG: hypothetical protein AB1641_09835 [Thermodesulfobacteriota bacterium]
MPRPNKTPLSPGFTAIVCPRCGRRLLDLRGLPQGDFDLEPKCPYCGPVRLNENDLKKQLQNSEVSG